MTTTPRAPTPAEAVKLLRWIARLFRCVVPCRHEFDYMREMTRRDADGNVSCRCHKCGEVFKAECGLDLPGTLIQKG